MARPSLPRIAAVLLCLALLAPASPPSARQSADAEPLSVLVGFAGEGDATRVTLAFSRKVDYRLEESRSRLHVLIDEPVLESSYIDRDMDRPTLRRLRFDRTRRGVDIMFYYGEDFGTFSSSELSDPFRLVLMFLPKGARLEQLAPPGVGPVPAVPSVTPGSPADEQGGILLSPEPTPERRPGEIRRIVLDPGHGGDEEGAVGRTGLKEKELVLDIARRLRSRLNRQGYQVDLTRDADQALDLDSRAGFANNKAADLFVSIHANASVRSSARGAETYFLSYGATDDDALAVARAENLPGEDGDDDQGGAGIDLVLWEMAQAEHIARSSMLADMIQTEMNQLAAIRDRGVKQAPFRVLVGADMPAVLVEVGFLSNADEERDMASEAYRERIAGSIATAIDRFARRVREEAGALSALPSGGPR